MNQHSQAPRAPNHTDPNKWWHIQLIPRLQVRQRQKMSVAGKWLTLLEREQEQQMLDPHIFPTFY